jgi:hypothetical protein
MDISRDALLDVAKQAVPGTIVELRKVAVNV